MACLLVLLSVSHLTRSRIVAEQNARVRRDPVLRGGGPVEHGDSG